MDAPDRTEFPFFAYGIFRPGQLGYLRLRDLVLKVTSPCMMKGTLRIRDGLPILDPDGSGNLVGAILEFKPDVAAEAYKRVAEIEPDKQYRWVERDAQGIPVNVLVGKSPRRGSDPCEEREWDGSKDPLFTSALEVIEETLNRDSNFEWDLKPLFRLQMAYLLLWSSVERYASLRYHLGDKVMEKVAFIADEPAFAEALKAHAHEGRYVFRADRPSDKMVLDSGNPKKSLEYYYQVRSNITHRGKATTRDHNILKDSLSELLSIFKVILKAAFDEARIDEHASAPLCVLK